ncbi:MAG: PIG-L family deacetylase [Candidatus Aminicenantes bacterium]|nr:PIG-L family deacetylase [Candidatus Aminicenantes bacterium]NIM78839.1 PIG-L family deacetylase [Candidatus Aminicenantes bacterium]NIN18095.1 PIG-L family deacetylase [Candidatus Aminicenantes bacterium]NIN41994.1 PIG-L family deacetylase [Candidatus Aminicenantes bacterium]NIN84750.1 PIG-L family deacetylase [Candidatus Aminicenantes bacterium]
MNQAIERILVLAPHTDDGEFGCGGSIAKFVEEGKQVFYAAFSTAEKSVPNGWPKNILETEVKEATKRIGIPPANLIIYKYEVRKLNYVRQEILEELIKIKKELNPHLVFMPTQNDLHQDHQTVATEAVRAFKQVSILSYELPWNTITFHTQGFIKLQQNHVEKKIQALQAYNSQSGKDYASEDFIRSWARTRGTQIGTTYAEAFEITRWVIE